MSRVRHTADVEGFEITTGDKERKKTMNRKLMVAVGMTGLAIAAFAKPQGGPPGGTPRPPAQPAPAPRGHHAAPPPARPHGSGWGRGGREFWPGFVGGVVGGLAAGAVATPTRTVTTVVSPPPVVVPAPVVVTPAPVVENVWVEGRYVDQPQPNGTVLRIWQPGHYETRTVR